MDELELMRRVEKWEDIHTEFKVRLGNNKELAKDIVCLANTDGGQLIFGVNEDKEIKGVDNLDENIRAVDDVAFNRCDPPVTVIQETVLIDNRTVLIVNIPKGSQRPYRTQSGQYYIRSTNRCRQASREELLRLFQANESIYYDETAFSKAAFSDLDLEYFRKFLSDFMYIEGNNDELERYLRNLHCINSQKQPTLAGLLFFGSNPQKFLPSKKMICAFIKGDDIAIPPADRKDITGRLPEVLENTERFLRLYLAEKHVVKGFEPETTQEIPEVALREAVVNALAHRDYTIDAPIRIIIYDNRVEIRTPGNLPNTVTIESIKIGGSHLLRNPSIYLLLSKMGMVTYMGSGVRRMIKLVEEHVKKPAVLQEIENEFVVVLPRS